jgi:tetratricopeptide (TPR) repeat protein
LRSIRDFSLDLLEESGEADLWRRRHAEFFAELADRGDPTNAQGVDTADLLARIEREYENLRAALAWALDRDEAELALRLCRALPAIWFRRGVLDEARRLVDRLQTLTFADDVQRANAINLAGRVAQIQGENSPEVLAKFEEALALYRAAGHEPGIARALMNLGNLRAREEAYEVARELFREALPLYRELGDVFGECGALMNLGDSYLGEDDLDRAEEMFVQATDTARRKGAGLALSFALQYMGVVAHHRDDLDGSEAYHREAMGIFEAFGARPNIGWSIYYLATLTRDRGDLKAARAQFVDAIERFRDLDYRPGLAVAMLGAATVESREGRAARAARLLGASLTLSRGTVMTRETLEDRARTEVREAGRAALGEQEFGRELEAGKMLAVDEALKLVRGEADRVPVEATGTR